MWFSGAYDSACQGSVDDGRPIAGMGPRITTAQRLPNETVRLSMTVRPDVMQAAFIASSS